MRVTVSHNKTRQEVKDSVDRGMDQVFDGFGSAVSFTGKQKQWQGDIMTFSMQAKVAFIESPIKGAVEVGDKEVIIDLDLGMLKMLVPEDKVKSVVESRVSGFLTSGAPGTGKA